MRQGKKPTLKQKKLLQAWNKNPSDWLIIGETAAELKAVYRYGDKVISIPKE